MNTITPYQNVLEQFQKDDTPPWYGVAARKLFYVAAFLTGERQSSNKYNLSPLHVAVMTGDLSTTEAFLKKGCNPNAKDHKGWTPLHHAALISKQMMTLLISFNASGTITNTNEGVPADLFHMANAPTIPLKHPIYALTDDGEEEELTREEFRARTGATYIEHPYIPSSDLIKLWTKRSPYNQKLIQNTPSLYAQYYSNPPKLALTTENPQDENGNKIPIGRSVVTLGDIPKGAIVAEYCGKYIEGEGENRSEYLLGVFDGARFRNLAPHVADGFPNVMADHTNAIRGVNRTVLIALESIPTGSSITFDYSTHQIKWGGLTAGLTTKEAYRLSHLELRPRALLSAVQARSIAKPLHTLDFRIIATVSYILNTPTTLFTLVLRGIVTAKEMQTAMSFHWNTNAYAVINASTLQVASLVKILNPKYALAKDCVLEAASRGRFQLMVNLLRWFGENPNEFIFPEGPLSKYFGILLDDGKELDATRLFNNLNNLRKIDFRKLC